PGDDRDLVRGFLISEQIVSVPGDVVAMAFEPETGRVEDESAEPALARVTLAPSIDLDAVAHTRVLDRSSACGLCGRLAVQPVRVAGGGRAPDSPRIASAVVISIPDQLRQGQAVFAETRGWEGRGG